MRKERPQQRELRALLSLRVVGGFFNVPQAYVCFEGAADGAFGLSSLSEKTSKMIM